jgi:ADP-dependent phosphofructokinase/glucokinase
MSASAWIESYEALIERLPDLAASARLTLGGFSACTDVNLSLQATIEPLRRAAPTGSPAIAMLDALERRALSGTGGELAVDWPAGPAWIDATVSGHRGIGGTSLQAAQMLAMLGAPAMAALEDRSSGQLAVIHPEVLVATEGGPRPRSVIMASGMGRSPHCIFEYTAGQTVRGSRVPRSSRTIVRFDHSELQHDHEFDRLSVELAAAAGAGIICGFNEVAPETLAAEIDYAAAQARAWRRAGLALVHLELGDFANEADCRTTIERMLPEVTSVGMSLSELRGIVRNEAQAPTAAILLAETFGLERICIHADEWALAVTRGDAEQELLALQAGSLLASSRAAAGDFTVPRRLPDSARFADPPWPRSSRATAGWSIVCCPAPYLERPAATIGLGDTFLAGTLLVLGGHATAQAGTAKVVTRGVRR